MRLIAVFLMALMGLTACGGEVIVASDAQVARYDTPGTPPPSVKLITVIRESTGSGGHSALVVNAPSQRVVFDPAGTFESEVTPERNDVHFGITPNMEKAYVDYHVRPAWYADIQTIEVSAAVAEQLLRDVKAYGAVSKAYCARSVSSILGNTPGFEDIDETWSPIKLSRQFGDRPGVRTRTVRDGDPDYTGFIVPLDPKTGLPAT